MTKFDVSLLFIIFLAAILRLFQITSVPALNADEAAIGYNVYSLLQTGKDEHGNPWPIEFQSFNDYKPGGYFYIVLPFVKILGLSELAVRLPNVILAVLSVYLIFVLANQLFPEKKLNIGHWTLNIGLIASFLLAISPWHLHFSRGGWEVNAATTFLLLGLVLFLKSLNIKILIYPSLLSFLAASYTYHSMRLLAPLILLFLIYWYQKEMRTNRKNLLVSCSIAFFVAIPILISIVRSQAGSRFAGVGILADRGPLSRAEELRIQHFPNLSIGTRFLHNRVVEYSLRFIDNYTRHFSYNFLFVTGDEIQRNKIPSMGLVYFFEIVSLTFGFLSLIKNHERNHTIIFIWLLLAPIASALTFQSPHALRAQNMAIPLTLISSLGLFNLIKLKNLTLTVTLTILMLWNIAYYLHQYYYHMAKSYPFSSQYGFKELVNFIGQEQHEYQKIIITDRYDQPYILTLFYLKYDPATFQNQHQLTPRDQYGFSTVDKFGKFQFQDIKWDEVEEERNSLILAAPEEIPPGVNSIKTINYPSGQPAFIIIST